MLCCLRGAGLACLVGVWGPSHGFRIGWGALGVACGGPWVGFDITVFCQILDGPQLVCRGFVHRCWAVYGGVCVAWCGGQDFFFPQAVEHLLSVAL